MTAHPPADRAPLRKHGVMPAPRGVILGKLSVAPRVQNLELAVRASTPTTQGGPPDRTLTAPPPLAYAVRAPPR